MTKFGHYYRDNLRRMQKLHSLNDTVPKFGHIKEQLHSLNDKVRSLHRMIKTWKEKKKKRKKKRKEKKKIFRTIKA